MVGLAAACGATATTPTPTTTSSSQFVVNTIVPGGTSVYAFTVSETSTVAVTLASITSAATGEVLPAALTVALGTPSGSSCTATTALDTTVALSSQISTSLAAGSYCVKITDADGLPESVTYAVRITATTGPVETSGLNGTESFASVLEIHGTSTRTFSARKGGNMAVTLTGAGGLDKVVRLTVGIWDGAACRLGLSADTAAASTPQIVAGVDAGMYCIRLADIGGLTAPASFSVSLEHP